MGGDTLEKLLWGSAPRLSDQESTLERMLFLLVLEPQGASKLQQISRIVFA